MHPAQIRRLDKAFEVDVLDRPKAKLNEVPASARDGAPVPLFLAGHDPLRVLMQRSKYEPNWAL